MKKIFFSIFLIFCLIICFSSTVYAQQLSVGKEKTIVFDEPSPNVKVVSIGYGIVTTTYESYINVNWAISDSGIIYVWDNTSSNLGISAVEEYVVPTVLVIIAVIIIISALMALLLYRKR